VQATRASARLLGLVDALFDLPVITIAGAARQMGVTHRAASQNVRKLVRLRILKEVSGRMRNRIYAAPEIAAAVERPL
jgi:Fic family protein